MPITIILADDHEIVRQGLRELLAGESDLRVVAEAESCRQTLKLARELAPEVIIMDISMPDLPGLEVCRQILTESPGVKIIALSMHADSLFVRNTLKFGALGYLLKDCALEELVQAIRTVMQQQTYISPGLAGTLIKDCAADLANKTVSVYAVLTSREREVLQLLAEGKNALQIADLIGITGKTVAGHRRRLMNKLGLHSVAELTKYAVRQGLTALEE